MKLKVVFFNLLFIISTSISMAQIFRGNSLTSGFFGYVDGATITNLSIDVAFYSTYAPATTATGPAGGGLVCSTIGTGNVLINNCSVTGVIDVLATTPSISIAQSYARAGGLVCSAASTAKLTIVNSTVNALVVARNDATTNISTSALANSGGIVGDVGSKAGQTVEVINCMTVGSVSAISTQYESYAGGIVGFNAANSSSVNVTNCLANNAVVGSGFTNTTLGGIVSNQVNTNSQTKNCMAMNPFITAFKATSGDPSIARIGVKSLGTYADNFALNGFLVQKTVESVGPTNATISSTDATNIDGADLGNDGIYEANLKLNLYVSLNPNFNSIPLNAWAGGAPTKLSVYKPILLTPFKYSVVNDMLNIEGIEGSKQLSIYTVTGKIVVQRMVSDTYSIPLIKGFYVFKFDGYNPCKIVVN